jgi:hypothetical protein
MESHTTAGNSPVGESARPSLLEIVEKEAVEVDSLSMKQII